MTAPENIHAHSIAVAMLEIAAACGSDDMACRCGNVVMCGRCRIRHYAAIGAALVADSGGVSVQRRHEPYQTAGICTEAAP